MLGKRVSLFRGCRAFDARRWDEVCEEGRFDLRAVEVPFTAAPAPCDSTREGAAMNGALNSAKADSEDGCDNRQGHKPVLSEGKEVNGRLKRRHAVRSKRGEEQSSLAHRMCLF